MNEELLTCPLCGQGSFLKRGLSAHLGNGHCQSRQRTAGNDNPTRRTDLSKFFLKRMVAQAEQKQP